VCHCFENFVEGKRFVVFRIRRVVVRKTAKEKRFLGGSQEGSVLGKGNQEEARSEGEEDCEETFDYEDPIWSAIKKGDWKEDSPSPASVAFNAVQLHKRICEELSLLDDSFGEREEVTYPAEGSSNM